MMWAITNGTYIFQDILKIGFDLFVSIHIAQGTKITFTRV